MQKNIIIAIKSKLLENPSVSKKKPSYHNSSISGTRGECSASIYPPPKNAKSRILCVYLQYRDAGHRHADRI